MDFFDNTSTKQEIVEPSQNEGGFDFLNNGEQVNNDNNANNNDPFQATNNDISNNQFPQVAQPPLEQVDEAEIQRQQDRMKEENERRQKIEEKMSIEIQKKNELKEKAMQFINDFEEKRRNAIELRKKENVKNEEYFMNNKKLEKEGKKNPWEIVTDNITLKESEYKGTKDISRMRNVIVARKNDSINQNSNQFGL